MNEYSATTGRLGRGLVGLEGDALGLGALFARDHVEDFFLGLGRRRVRADAVCRTFARFGFGEDDGRDSMVDSSCSRHRRV